MKPVGLLLVAGLCLPLFAEDVESRRAEALGSFMKTFRTLEGKTYSEVVITRVNDGGVSFNHADGAVRLRFSDLSPDQQKYFGITKEAAARTYEKENARQAAYEIAVAERNEKFRAAAEKKAAEFEELRRLEPIAAAEVDSSEKSVGTIPPYPTLQRVDTRPRRFRTYGSYGRFYGSPVYYGLHSRHYGRFGKVRYGCPTPSIVIRR